MASRKTIEKIQRDSTVSQIWVMACGCINESRKANGHIHVGIAAVKLALHYNDMSFVDAKSYILDIITHANDLEHK